jgi:hypothetical protein
LNTSANQHHDSKPHGGGKVHPNPNAFLNEEKDRKERDIYLLLILGPTRRQHLYASDYLKKKEKTIQFWTFV